MKKLLILSTFVLVMGLMFPSCYYDKEETLYPFKKCDTTNVTFSQTIVPVITANCLLCHSTSTHPNTVVILDTYAGVKNEVSNGKLIPSIDHTGPKPMPNGGSMLDACTIQQFKKWVSDGAPNN